MRLTPRRLLLIGPLPPPDHGTSVPFRLLVETIEAHRGAQVRVVNTQSGDKAGVPLHSPRAFVPFLTIWWRTLRAALWCDAAISYGSQRFSCTVGSLTVVLLRLLGKPMHVRVAGGGFDNYYFGLASWKRRLIRLCMSRAASFAVETRLVGERMASEFSNLLVMPNWIDIHSAGNSSLPPATGDNEFRFGFIAEIREEKGVLELLAAFEGVRQTLSDAGIPSRLELVGSVRPDFLERFRSAMEAASGVAHLGQVDLEQLMPWIRNQHVLLLPTKFENEGYPGVVLEALALGVPVIVSRWRALPEIVADGHNGLLCEAGEVASLAKQMEMIAKNSALRERLAANARADGQRFQVREVLQPLLDRCGLTKEAHS
jgi:glycosyltransferase involved in cell wall biosynthesis